jgi:hypothetical protein
MQVYFARSIRGQHAEGEKPFFEAIINTIKKGGHTLALEVPSNQDGLWANRDQYIYNRDIEWIYNSNAMIAEVSNPSLGVGYEIAYAVHVCRIPVLAVAYKDTNVSAMIQGSLDVFFYRGASDLETAIQTFLEDVPESAVDR